MRKACDCWLLTGLLSVCLLCACADKRSSGAGEGHAQQEAVAAQTKGDSAHVEAEKKTPEEAVAVEEAEKVVPMPAEGVMMSLMGNIGGAPATLDMEGHEGFYEYELRGGRVKRNLKLESYDKRSGHIVLQAIDKNTGKLVGRFDGTFVIECNTDDEGEEHCFNSYTGVFTNVKGAKVDFMLYID